MSKVTYCWSTDEEEYRGKFDSREDALAEAVADGLDDREPGEPAVVWTAEVRDAMHFLRKWEWRIGERVIEDLDQSLYDEIAADEAIVEMDKEAATELGRLILDFVEKRASFNRYGVDNIEEHEVIVPKEEE